MSEKIVISLCDRTGNACIPWAEAGYTCYAVDLQHSIRKDRVEQVGAGQIVFTWGDARSWFPPAGKIAFAMAQPPCTHVTSSDARDFKKKAGWMLSDALQLFDSCMAALEYSRAPYWIENPVGRFNTHRRKPDHFFHPWQYAGYLPDIQTDNTKKKTGLWAGGGFIMPKMMPAPEPHREDCWLASPSDDRGDIRSVTPMGFARAVFAANNERHAGT